MSNLPITYRNSYQAKIWSNKQNITLILENDPALKAVVFNQLADNMEIKGEAPWKHPARFWRDALTSGVEQETNLFQSMSIIQQLIAKTIGHF